MTAQLISQGAVALIFEAGEKFVPSDTAAIIDGLLAGAGLEPWPEAVVEMFDGGGAILIIARPAPQRGTAVSADFEDIIRAARACPDGASSALYLLDGHYVLYMTLPLGTHWHDMDEFCLGGAGGGYAARAREHGRALIERGAADKLRKIFQ